ncbi:MAG: TIGR00341 family protein, partial [Alistipes sp.]|nr:TIGR00341 family protein [Alistipes sp.]
MENTNQTGRNRRSFRLLAELRIFLRERFSLEEDKAPQSEVETNISKGTEFRGVNLWVLIFA